MLIIKIISGCEWVGPGVNIPGVNLNESANGRDGNNQTTGDRAWEEAVTRTKYTEST